MIVEDKHVKNIPHNLEATLVAYKSFIFEELHTCLNIFFIYYLEFTFCMSSLLIIYPSPQSKFIY